MMIPASHIPRGVCVCGGLDFANYIGDETTVRSEIRTFGEQRQVGLVDRRRQVLLGKKFR